MLRKKLPIIIVGGGLGGLTTAIALAQKDIASIVLEQAPEFRETGAGIQLCPNVFKVFDRLGILPSILKVAVFPDNLVYIDGVNGHRFLQISLGQELIDHFYYPYGVFHRVELLMALVKECQKLPQIKLMTGAHVTRIEEEKESVKAILSNGASVEGELMIGCDGLWSVTRGYVAGKQRPRFTKHVAHRGVVPLNQLDANLRPNNVVHWVRDHSHLVHYPISTDGLLNIIAIYSTEHDYQDDNLAGNKEELDHKFQGSQPEIAALIPHLNFSRKWLLYDRDPLEQWSKGRVILLGDAVHPTLPYLTQGAGMAIEDAYVLTRELSSHPYEEAFARFQKERFLRTSYVQLFSRAYGESHHSTGIARELRNLIIGQRSAEENYEWLSHLWKGIDI